ncbi:hypothetical protein F5Y04DRAFT_247522 [Hypomontagnella monticulosa]|nr:hypothetical protein F5Y04DRAFT_247522 [Hypomontagnella monticulosa]
MFSTKFIFTVALALIPSLATATPHCWPSHSKRNTAGAEAGDSLTWTVLGEDKNSPIDQQSLKLRAKDNAVVVDASAPQLITDFRDGALYLASDRKGTETGPTGGLRNASASASDGYTMYAIEFKSGTDVDKNWSLEQAGGSAGSKTLQHALTIAKGRSHFYFCPQGDGNKTYQVYFMVEYKVPGFPNQNCEVAQIKANYLTGNSRQADEVCG